MELIRFNIEETTIINNYKRSSFKIMLFPYVNRQRYINETYIYGVRYSDISSVQVFVNGESYYIISGKHLNNLHYLNNDKSDDCLCLPSFKGININTGYITLYINIVWNSLNFTPPDNTMILMNLDNISHLNNSIDCIVQKTRIIRCNRGTHTYSLRFLNNENICLIFINSSEKISGGFNNKHNINDSYNIYYKNKYNIPNDLYIYDPNRELDSVLNESRVSNINSILNRQNWIISLTLENDCAIHITTFVCKYYNVTFRTFYNEFTPFYNEFTPLMLGYLNNEQMQQTQQTQHVQHQQPEVQQHPILSNIIDTMRYFRTQQQQHQDQQQDNHQDQQHHQHHQDQDQPQQLNNNNNTSLLRSVITAILGGNTMNATNTTNTMNPHNSNLGFYYNLINQYELETAKHKYTDSSCIISHEVLEDGEYYYECNTCKCVISKDLLKRWIETENKNKCPQCRTQLDEYPQLYKNVLSSD